MYSESYYMVGGGASGDIVDLLLPTNLTADLLSSAYRVVVVRVPCAVCPIWGRAHGTPSRCLFWQLHRRKYPCIHSPLLSLSLSPYLSPSLIVRYLFRPLLSLILVDSSLFSSPLFTLDPLPPSPPPRICVPHSCPGLVAPCPATLPPS